MKTKAKITSSLLADQLFASYFELLLNYFAGLTVAVYAYEQDPYIKPLDFFHKAKTLVNESASHLQRMRKIWPSGEFIYENFDRMFYWHDEWIENFRRHKEAEEDPTIQSAETVSENFKGVTERQFQIEKYRAQHREAADIDLGLAMPGNFDYSNLEKNLGKRITALMNSLNIPQTYYSAFS